jgi:hypothetical protein
MDYRPRRGNSVWLVVQALAKFCTSDRVQRRQFARSPFGRTIFGPELKPQAISSFSYYKG